MKIKIFTALIYPLIAKCIFIGNPASPSLQKNGVLSEGIGIASIRTSYFQDYVYKHPFKEEFRFEPCENSVSQVQLWTQGGVLILNFLDRLDIYGILGGQRVEMNETHIDQTLAWGFGGKLLLLKKGNFHAGCDIKYLESKPKPHYFECDQLAYNIQNDFHYKYHEAQGALGISYQTNIISPYANASFLISKLRSMPPSITLKIPTENMEVDVIAKSQIGRTHIGMALGATITDKKRASLSFEWRGFNQNAIDISGDIRF